MLSGLLGPPLPLQEAGVFAVVKDVFLPWYNAYRCVAEQWVPQLPTGECVHAHVHAHMLAPHTCVAVRMLVVCACAGVGCWQPRCPALHICRFLVQNVTRLEVESGSKFEPSKVRGHFLRLHATRAARTSGTSTCKQLTGSRPHTRTTTVSTT